MMSIQLVSQFREYYIITGGNIMENKNMKVTLEVIGDVTTFNVLSKSIVKVAKDIDVR